METTKGSSDRATSQEDRDYGVGDLLRFARERQEKAAGPAVIVADDDLLLEMIGFDPVEG